METKVLNLEPSLGFSSVISGGFSAAVCVAMLAVETRFVELEGGTDNGGGMTRFAPGGRRASPDGAPIGGCRASGQTECAGLGQGQMLVIEEGRRAGLLLANEMGLVLPPSRGC